MGSIVKGIGHIVGGLASGVKDVFTGHPIKAVKDVAKGVTHGALDILSNPLVGFCLGGPMGMMMSGAAGQLDARWDAHDMQSKMQKQAMQMQRQMSPFAAGCCAVPFC